MPTLHLQRTILPPLGHLAPAKQDSIHSAANLNIATLPLQSQQTLPVGFEVFAIGSGGAPTALYAWTGSAWEDETTSEIVTATDITGIVHFRNPADFDVEFVW